MATPEFPVFLGMLAGHAETLNEQLIMRDDLDIALVRGQLRAFVAIQKTVDGASEQLYKFNNQQE
jgi:hypothetical protein